MPTVVLFKTTSNLLSLAFVQRRPHKRDPDRDVLGRVSLVREINTHKPHRAHLDILGDLSLAKRLQWINTKEKGQNFDGLLAAWLDALDTKELNQQFYRQLFTWFERAVREAKFPTNEKKTLSPEEHIIRLITRLLFIWFIKEKGLVAPELFVQEKVKHYLKNYDQNQGDSYYRVVLQNLFFSTLNTQIDKRSFSKADQSSHRNFNRYRYQDEIADVDGLLALFAQTPFINGGLFECLDSFENYTAGGYRIDCFTDNVNDPSKREYQMVSVPNRLFFDDDGLITLFDRYKFTIEESTPVEQEVALDPELLGKAFENLLAAYNPETRETARKSTGSYYTPTVVVNYMVDESLIEFLVEKTAPFDGDVVFWRDRLRYLLDYEDACNDAFTLFMKQEREELIRSIAEMKIIDPAVGSGAFLIAILHKMSLVLRRLDPDNMIWAGVQRGRALSKAAKAFATDDYEQRSDELAEINEIFETYRYSDFGRKIYLIQNSIFGVDIQLIACQIAKLRFFISLAIEQDLDKSKINFGIRPLPNLEAQILAADTLLSLEGTKQRKLPSMDVLNIEHEIAKNRERHYHANTRNQKWDIVRDFENLRLQLIDALKESGFPSDASEKLASWSPYDQNSCADWFDPEYMFGITEGFDIVIGNPPYIQLQKDGGKLGNRYEKIGYSTFVRIGDIYQLFYEKGCQLLNSEGGLLCYITSNSWLKANFGKKTRKFFVENCTPLLLLETGEDVFENAVVDTSIFLCSNRKSSIFICRAVDMDRLQTKVFPPIESHWGQLRSEGDEPWRALLNYEHNVISKMESKGTKLKEWDLLIKTGVKTGNNRVFMINSETKQELINKDMNSIEILKPVLRGRDIKRYQVQYADMWLICTRPNIRIKDYPAVYSYLQLYQDSLLRKASNKWYEISSTFGDDSDNIYSKEKLFWRRVSKTGTFAYVAEEIYAINAVNIIHGRYLKYLCAVLNSKCIAWYVEPTIPRSGTGTLQWEKAYVETLPIPILEPDKQQPFVKLVDDILNAKTRDPGADIREQEAEIDRLVYQLYGLTEEEIAVVEGR